MKKTSLFFCKQAIVILIGYSSINCFALDSQAKAELKQQYHIHCAGPSDIFEHVSVLHDLSIQCTIVTEIGLRTMNSTWGILQGLSENPSNNCVYTGIDLDIPPADIFNRAKSLAERNNIKFNFVHANDMDIDIDPTELLFIDSMHTYCHLTYELEKFCGKVSKFIAMHDTDEPWGFIDDFQQYHGDKSEYPDSIDKTKAGLWQAVLDFLDRHPEWILQERRTNNHGFTILKRVES